MFLICVGTQIIPRNVQFYHKLVSSISPRNVLYRNVRLVQRAECTAAILYVQLVFDKCIYSNYRLKFPLQVCFVELSFKIFFLYKCDQSNSHFELSCPQRCGQSIYCLECSLQMRVGQLLFGNVLSQYLLNVSYFGQYNYTDNIMSVFYHLIFLKICSGRYRDL